MTSIFSARSKFSDLSQVLSLVKTKYFFQNEFIQAVEEVAESIAPVCQENAKYVKIFQAMCEPERVIQFRVDWMNDAGDLQHNIGYRVQFNSALGPYKGGLRFHHSVNPSILKFLGFEQTFKNALTGLALGGGKGGSDFDPKGKSPQEIRSFCHAFMTLLFREIGPTLDVPAGDIGVGARELGFLYSQYRKLSKSYDGALTGKGLLWGGSHLRPEATGYGAVYFANVLLNDRGISTGVSGKRCAVSGSGNAAQFCAKKLIESQAEVLSLSDTSGTLEFKAGLNLNELNQIMHLKNIERLSLSEFFKRHRNPHLVFHANTSPWLSISAMDLAFPCATQNEIDFQEASAIINAGALGIVEVANMPCTQSATKKILSAQRWIAPSKAANAGGVAVSGLEMTQNSGRLYWTEEQVDHALQKIMTDIYWNAQKASEQYSKNDLIAGANIAGFLKVAQSMFEQELF